MNKFKNETAVIIITCNRESFFRKLYDSIDKESVDKIYVVNAGDRYSEYPDDVEVIFPKRNPTVVGIAKNLGLRKAKADGYKYLFLVEDDVLIKDNKVWEEYILTAADSGLWTAQLSYGVHGGIAGGNVNKDGTPKRRAVVDYTSKKVDLYLYSFQAFTLIHADHLTDSVYFREIYSNAAEHLDQHQTIFLKEHKGVPILWHPDIHNSFLYIEDQDSNHTSSVIRKSKDFHKNFSDAWGEFKLKFGYHPQNAPVFSQDDVLKMLEDIEGNYSNKDLL
jgi:hypothetical protein